MMHLAVLADDLTGALDTAAQFCGLCGPVPTFWRARGEIIPPVAAVDSGTREYRSCRNAMSVVGRISRDILAPALAQTGIAYKKIDSQLRGHTWPEVVACIRALSPKRVIIAPAFPFHGRITRNGHQMVRRCDGVWDVVGDNPVAALRAADIPAKLLLPGNPVAEGVCVYDAETDQDIQRIVDAGRHAGAGTLWCGSGGLGAALAGTATPVARLVQRPVLGLFGTHHPVTQLQLAACRDRWLVLPENVDGSLLVSERLKRDGVALVSVGLDASCDRSQAAAAIARAFTHLAHTLDRPGTLIVSGGETLRTLCVALDARELTVHGQTIPGVACATLCGGRWSGLEIVAKSGAFGASWLLRDIVDLHKEMTL